MCQPRSAADDQAILLVLQAGELPNLRWQIGVLVANIERLNNVPGGPPPGAQALQDQARLQDSPVQPSNDGLKHNLASGT